VTPFERWTLRLGALLAVVTGVGLGVVRYLGGVEGEFGPEPSPHLPAWQHAHVLAVPVLVFAIGLAVAGHARGPFERRRRPGFRSGLAVLALSVPLVFGGALIQVVTAAEVRAWVGWIHAGVGGLFALAWLVHWGKRLRLRRSARAAAPAPRDEPGFALPEES
jgi:hypothetical protein